MKKLFFLFAAILAACLFLTISVYAAYSYGNPPGPSGHWNFAEDQSYTISGCMDLLYRKGSWGLFTDTMTSATTNMKAKSYYYSHADVGIQGSDGNYDVTVNYLPDHSGYDFSTTIRARTYKAAQFVRYDGKYYQMSGGHQLINITEYHYNSDDRVVKPY